MLICFENYFALNIYGFVENPYSVVVQPKQLFLLLYGPTCGYYQEKLAGELRVEIDKLVCAAPFGS